MDFKSLLKISFVALCVSFSGHSTEENNHIPQAEAGKDQFANVSQVVKLNASDSTDKDGNRLNYHWKVVSRPDGSTTQITNPSHVTSFIEIDQAGSYVIELTVSDGADSASIDTMMIDTNETKPQLSVINSQKLLAGETAYIDGSEINDPDGDELLFSWQLKQKPIDSNAIIEDADSANPIIATDALGKYALKLNVTDGKTGVEGDVVNIYAVDFFEQTNRTLGCVLDRIFFDGFEGLFSNTAPVADVGPDKLGVIGEMITLDGSLSNDIDQDSLTYSWSLLTSPNGSTASITNADQEMATLSPDLEGDYVAQLIVNDGCLGSDPDSALVTISVNQPPVITSAPDTSAVESQVYAYQVTATDPEGHVLSYDLTLAPSGLDIDSDGLITTAGLDLGTYPVTVVVSDPYGGSDSQSFDLAVTVNNSPVIQSFPLSSAEQGLLYEYQIVATDADDDPISYQLLNPVVGMSIDANGLISWTPDALGSFQVEVEASDGSGGIDIQLFSLEVIELPPNPVDIAPPLSRTDFPPFIETIDFLYESNPPIQVGMPPGTIQGYRAVVMKGRALDADGSPLPGVKVTINNHPEYGHTYTRTDGQYDLVVNGGGTLTVNFEKGGFLPLQRDVKTQWEEYAYSEDVVLIRLDDQVTKIDLSDNSVDFHVAQGSIVTDVDGTRQTTILFPSGLNASMQMSDGSSQALSSLDVRATEYTVGSMGPKRMPGTLPASSGYTFAVELSVDQAIDAQAISVNFDQPVPFYVDNFLNFPQGLRVPLGYYDRELAYWVPAPSGKVIKILRIENGQAVLDVSDDGIDNDASQMELDVLGITTAELIQLAGLYPADKTLWRSQVEHFTPWDCNWPYGPPDDIKEIEMPPVPEPPEDEADDTPEEEPEGDDEDVPCDGCIIDVNNRSLGESVPVVGTEINLHYKSNQTNFGTVIDSYEIPITSDNVHQSLNRIELTVHNNGNGGVQTFSFQPSANLKHTINWDGKDVYGRDIHRASVRYSLNHYYDAVYYSTDNSEGWERSFSVYQERGNRLFSSRETTEVILQQNNTFDLFRRYADANNLSPQRGKEEPLENIREEQLKMGGWMIEGHHVYDPEFNILYQGNGFARSVTALASSLEHVGSNGGPAAASPIGKNIVLAVGPDNSSYLHDPEVGQIKKITEDGTILRIAGKIHVSPPFPFCIGVEPVEGESAYNLCLTDIDALAIHPNGEVFFSYDRRIRKIDANGLVNTVVGDGSFGISPDGTPALLAQINAKDISFDKHGTLYFLESGRLRKIDSDGNIQTVAGGGFIDPFDPEVNFSGLLATETELFNPESFDISDNGNIVIADRGHRCFRQVTADGYIYTIAGSAPCYISPLERDGDETQSVPQAVTFDNQNAIVYVDASDPNWIEPINKIVKVHPFGQVETLNNNMPGYSGDSGDFFTAQVNHPQMLAIDNNGELLIADTENARLRKVRSDNSIITIAGGVEHSSKQSTKAGTAQGSALIKGSKQNYFVGSRNGLVLHEFSPRGSHLKTLNSLTGRVLVQYEYDMEGILSSVIDKDGLTTQITRNQDGDISQFISPYGKVTQLDYFANGLLESVTDPSNNDWSFEYTNNNLSAFIDRNNHRYDYVYEDGLLSSDSNPIGGGWQLNNLNDVTGSNTVTMISGEGREFNFLKDSDATNFFATKFINTDPDATAFEKTINDYSDEYVYADGTIYSASHKGTDRLGSHQKFYDTEIIQTPGGVQYLSVSSLEETTSSPDVIAPVLTSILTRTINGQSWVSQYDSGIGAHGGYQFMSPMNRTSLMTLDEEERIKSQVISGIEPFLYDYDSQGKITRMYQGSDDDLRETIFTYYNSGSMNGELQSITNAVGHTVNFEYDDNGRMTKQTMPDGREVFYGYDANSNLISLTPPGRPTHTFNYNGVDQETEYAPPALVGLSEPETNYEYNLDQQLVRITRPDGLESVLNYDSITGKLQSNVLPNGTYTFAYDGVTGRLNQINSPDGITLDFEFDGFLPTKSTWSGDVLGNVSRTYDSLFRVASRSVNDAHTINFSYDHDNLLTQAGALNITREAQKAGRVNGTTIGNVSSVISYNDFGEMINHDWLLNNVSIYNNSYTRDKLGRITAKSEILDGVTTNFEYEFDLGGRLVEVKTNGVVTKTWNYDLNDNRTHEDGVLIATYDDQDRLITYDGSSFTYTDNGELLSKTTGPDTIFYNYDVLGNLLSVMQADGTLIEYLIDGRGRRVGKKVDGVFVKGWLYKDGVNPVAEIDSLNNITARFVYANKRHVPSHMIVGPDTYRIISNHLGSPIRIINVDTGVVAQQISYDEWGNTTSDTNPGFQPFGFAGGHYDPDTGLIRFGTRDYDPTVSRWTAKDTIKFDGSSTNLYEYVSQDPINRIDPYGEADLHLLNSDDPFDRRMIKDGDEWANDPREFVLLVHGNEFGLIDKRENARNNKYLDYDDLADEIISNKKLRGGMPVRLLGCNSANAPDGGESPAQKLADALANKGKNNPVIAPHELVRPTTPDLYKQGYRWSTFKGRNKK